MPMKISTACSKQASQPGRGVEVFEGGLGTSPHTTKLFSSGTTRGTARNFFLRYDEPKGFCGAVATVAIAFTTEYQLFMTWHLAIS